MKKININQFTAEQKSNTGYRLDASEKYVVNIAEELEGQMAILGAFNIFGPPPALKNYHAWLFENGFNTDMPNPTNEFVAPYYGVKPLWRTAYSQGIVVLDEDLIDYYILMECSSKNKGYKHTIVVLTLGGCL